MRSSAKTLFTILVTATLASPLAEANTESGAPGGTSPPRRGAGTTLAAKANKAPAASKVQPAQRPAVAAGPAAGASLPPVQRPSALPGESEHVARYDAAIAPLRNLTLAEEDAALLREAISTGANGKLAEAKGLRDRIKDAATRKLVDWFIFRAGYGTATEIKAFLEANPAWPDRNLLTQRAEEALFNSPSASAREIKAFFAGAEPRTGVGQAALAAAFLADKEADRAKALAVKAWTEYDIPASLEPAFLKRIGPLLSEADHKRRLNRLLLNDSRWTNERNERAAIIKRMLPLLSEPEKKAAEARLAVFLRAKNSQALIAKLPTSTVPDWGLAVQKAQALRRQNKEEEAWKILLSEPEAPGTTKPDGWWEERRANAYAALRLGKPKMAYELVREPGPLSINAAKDAAFLAGWLSLRYLDDEKQALAHFQMLSSLADGPLSRARANYWLGRTFEALGDKGKALDAYRAGAVYFDTFHGQLARLKVDPGASRLNLALPAAPSPEEIARFTGSDAVRAIVVARKAGLDAALPRAFLRHLPGYLKSEAEVAMLAHLADALGDTQMSVRVGKAAVARGMNLAYYAYPVRALPPYTPLRKPPEPAVILGIARQESEFNTLTLSGAGARGILQVMPVTAHHVCRDYKIKCDIPRLMKDPVYNTMMGSAYISDRMDEFSGSYVLTLAGYNAGPGRAREWIREFGDPRDQKVDPIDWIHRIPFEETREYVQKVLSNIQIYRARLGDEANAVRLNTDLRRTSTAGTDKATAAQ
ncbi:MAG TPA: lytic transglycosylase domain-containing protein [Hyphomicrobiaceae bacterium]|jgi:soluble lytic murein transglycosylase|nr:lytic transglycosylase domain-containing protein [Hyphomicrobiaceae bacterium]